MYRDVIKPAQDFDAYIAELGDLPEISAAAQGLMAAIDLTEQEIANAVFATRFNRNLTNFHRNFLEDFPQSLILSQALRAEGEAGIKRFSLEAQLRTVNSDLSNSISKLVAIRADLKLSQMDL